LASDGRADGAEAGPGWLDRQPVAVARSVRLGLDWWIWRIALHERIAASPAEVASWSWCEVWEAHAALDAHEAMTAAAVERAKQEASDG